MKRGRRFVESERDFEIDMKLLKVLMLKEITMELMREIEKEIFN